MKQCNIALSMILLIILLIVILRFWRWIGKASCETVALFNVGRYRDHVKANCNTAFSPDERPHRRHPCILALSSSCGRAIQAYAGM